MMTGASATFSHQSSTNTHTAVVKEQKDWGIAGDAHAALMVKFPDMQHDEPHMAHVAPGKTSELIWTFNRPGTYDFACLIAGHYQAGMVGTIQVAASK